MATDSGSRAAFSQKSTPCVQRAPSFHRLWRHVELDQWDRLIYLTSNGPMTSFTNIYIMMKLVAIIVRCHPETQEQELSSYPLGSAKEMGHCADVILYILMGNLIILLSDGYTQSL